MSEKPPIYLVDGNDAIIGQSLSREVDSEKDIYRVSAVWVFNSLGQVLLAQRKFTKKKDPGLWGPSVAGTVEVGETYEENAVKETEEELGVKDAKLTLLRKVRVTEPYNYFSQIYKTVVDWDIDQFTLQEDEVEQIAWMTVEGLEQDLRENPQKYLTSMNDVVAVLKEEDV